MNYTDSRKRRISHLYNKEEKRQQTGVNVIASDPSTETNGHRLSRFFISTFRKKREKTIVSLSHNIASSFSSVHLRIKK